MHINVFRSAHEVLDLRRISRCALRSGLILAFAAALVSGCKGEIGSTGCTSAMQCPSGHVCQSGECVQTCTSTRDCVAGYVCTADLCVPYSSRAPSFSSIKGNGSTSCADSPEGTCFANALLVSGSNLGRASFGLEATDGNPSFALNPSQQTSSSVVLPLPTALVEGRYALAAQNEAGVTKQEVMILQGEPGTMNGDEIVERINTNATSSFVVARLPAANDVINHINSGSVKIDPDVLPPASGGTSYSGDDIVNLINTDATSNIAAERLPAGNQLIGRINQGDGSVKLSESVLPSTGSGGPASGEEVVALLNDGVGTSTIDAGRLATPNELVNRINSASNNIGVAQLPVGTTSSTVAAGNHSHGSTAGQLHLQRTANTAGSSIAINDSALTTLCQDADGCAIQLGFRYWHRADTDEDVPAISWGPPCRFHMDAQRNWAMSQWCMQRYEINNGSGTDFYGPYDSAQYGRDNSTADGRAYWYVMRFYAATDPVCVISEAPIGGTDNQEGFYFWMTTSTNSSFQSSSRTCELLIQD